MNQSRFPKLSILLGFSTFWLVVASGALASGMPTKFSWRYYRPTNTGIQGDYCEALRVTSNGDPWIGAYDPGFEEGGLCKFNQAQNTWVNISNVDYKVIGHPDNTGTSRISDIDLDASGNFWMATGRGGLFYSPTLGPVSLRRFGDDNSPIPGGWNKGVEVAPDGTVWFSSYSTVWGSGGLAKYKRDGHAIVCSPYVTIIGVAQDRDGHTAFLAKRVFAYKPKLLESTKEPVPIGTADFLVS
jgi:hypothetical protein